MDTTYYLYYGSSCDGRGIPKYEGRTQDKAVAQAHLNRIALDPYSFGGVRYFDDKQEHFAHRHGEL